MAIIGFLGIFCFSGLVAATPVQSLEVDIQSRNYFRYLGVVARVNDLAWGLEAFDFDNNDRIDLALGLGNGTVAILQYRGIGVYSRVSAVHNLGTNVYGIASGDLTGDGFEDIIVGNREGKVHLLVNHQGTGVFQIHPQPLVDAGSEAFGLALADFRDVGKLDIVVGNSEGQIRHYSNRGNLTFERTRLGKAIDVGHNAWGLAVGDFDLNGWLDIVVGDIDGEVEIFFNRGNSSESLEFSTDAYEPIGIRNPVTIGIKAPRDRTIGVNAYGVDVGDFDKDGFPDVIIGDGIGNVAVFYMDENGKLQWSGYLTSTISPYGIAVADFDQDGDDDVIVGSGAEYGQAGSVKLYLNIPVDFGSGEAENVLGFAKKDFNILLIVLGLVFALSVGVGSVATAFWYSAKVNMTVSQLMREIGRTTWMAITYSFQNLWKNKRRTVTLAIGFLVGGSLVSAAFIYTDTAPRLGIRSALQEIAYEIKVDPDFPWNDPDILANVSNWASTQDLVEKAEIVYRTISIFGSNELLDTYYLGVQGEGASDPEGLFISNEWGAFGSNSEFFDSISSEFEVEGQFAVDRSSIVISRSFAAEIEKKNNITIRAGSTFNFSIAQQRPDKHLYEPVYLSDYSRVILNNMSISGIYQRRSTGRISSLAFAEETLGEAVFFDASLLSSSARESLFLDHLLPTLFIRFDRDYMERIGLLRATDEIERFAIDLEGTFRYVDVIIQTDHIQEVQSHYQNMSIVILFLIVPSVILAIILTYFCTDIIIRGRGREVATLKSRGAGFGELVIMMGSELFIIATIMAFASVLLGLLLSGFIPSTSSYLNLDIGKAYKFSRQAKIPNFAWLGSFLVCEGTFLFFTLGPIRKFIYSDIDIIIQQEKRIKESFITQHSIDFLAFLSLFILFIVGLISDFSVPWLDEDQNRSLYFAGTIFLWFILAYSSSRAASNFLPRLARFLKSILSYRVVFVAGNLGRRKTQVVSLILILTFVFSVGVFAAISKDVLSRNARDQLHFQVGADSRVQTTPVSSNFAVALEEEPGVHQATAVVQAPAVLGGRSILMLGVDPSRFQSMLRWRDDAIKSPSNANELFQNFQSSSRIIVNSGIADKLNLNIGDTTDIYAVGGNWNNFIQLRVAGVVDLVPGFGEFSKSFDLPYSRILDKDGGLVLVNSEILTSIADNNANVFFLSLEKGVSSQMVKKQLLQRSEVLQVVTIDDVIEEEHRSISLFGLSGAFFLTFFISVFLGICSLVIFLNYLIEVRKQEYAIMRAGGATRTQIILIILSEFLFMLGASFIMGLMLGIAFSIIFVILASPLLPNLSLFAVNPLPVSLSDPLAFFFQEIFFVLIGSLLFSFILMFLGLVVPARRAGATNVSETLRNL